jgi:hypothetical protein
MGFYEELRFLIGDFGFWICDFGLGGINFNPKSQIQNPK